jgi:hypothetical protein
MEVRHFMKEILGELQMDAIHVLVLQVGSVVHPYLVLVVLVMKIKIVNLEISV